MATPSWTAGAPRRILLATDLSCRCDRALDRAVELARGWRTELVVVHALQPRIALESDAYADLPSWRRPPDREKLIRDQIARDVGANDVTVSVVCERGEPAEIIERVAQERGCGLIVTGIARDETLGRHLLGSTVERLVRRSPVPVLVVKNRVHGEYRKLVVATDFSESALHALNAAYALFPQREITLFHAYEVPFAGLLDKSDLNDRFHAAERETIDDFIARADTQGDQAARTQALVERGAPDHLLRSLAEAGRVDLVVLGTHGRSAVFEVLIGGTARRILQSVPADILIVREPRSVG